MRVHDLTEDRAPGDAGLPDASWDTSTEDAREGGVVADGEALNADAEDSGPVIPLLYEVEGLVVGEAEHYFENEAMLSQHAWYLTNDSVSPGVVPDPDAPHVDGASGRAYMEALPDIAESVIGGINNTFRPGEGPVLRFRVLFQTPGTYVVWVRGYQSTGFDSSLYVGLDGVYKELTNPLQICWPGAWEWTSSLQIVVACSPSGLVTIDVVNPGEHVVEFSLREDGFEFDKFVLTKDSSYVPSGTGPDETSGPG